ncbi:MAG: FG-GAP repeat domain-containing protein [Planctomycetota bacterium]
MKCLGEKVRTDIAKALLISNKIVDVAATTVYTGCPNKIGNFFLEDIIVQPIRIILAIVLVITIFANSTPFCKEIPIPEPDENAEQTDPNADPNNISAYYGFGEMEIIKLDWGIKCLRIADFDGDGRNDIAVVNNRKAKIELRIQKEAVGPGEKAVAVDPEDVDVNLLTPPTRFEKHDVPVSQRVFSFVVGDLNSDGMMDLAFYAEPKGLYVILQKAGEGEPAKALNWRVKKKIKIDDGLVTATALVCADLNNDGADDLALAARDAVYIVLQKEDGSLAEPVKYPTTTRPLGIEVADLNADNINDLILIASNAEKQVHVRFGLKTGQLGPQVQFFIEKPWALKFADIDAAAGDEILTVDAVSKRLICYKFEAEKDSDADWPILFYPLTSGKENTKRDLVVGDFDGDGLVDITISEPGAAELVFYKQTAELGLAEPVRFPAFADIAGLSVADIDSDGKAELAVLSVKEKIIGISQFENERLSFPQPVKLSGEAAAMELADVDSDGSIDCVYVSKDVNDTRAMRVIYNLGKAGKRKSKRSDTAKTRHTLELKKLTSNPDGLRVLDVDQDGLQDVLIFVKYESPVLIRQAKKGAFEIVDSPGTQAGLIKDASLHSTFVAEVDGQAGKELLVAQKNFARSLVFAKGQSWSIIDQYNAKSTENKVSAVEGPTNDEDPATQPAILLLDGQKGQLQILKAGDDKTYRFVKELDVGKWNTATHLKMLFAPLTGSEAKSILLFDSEKFALITPPSTDNLPHYLEQQFTYETKIKDGVYGNLTAGDINADGRPDIIMVEYKRNHIEILALDSQTRPIPAMRFKIFEQKSYRSAESRAKSSVEPRELKIADVTGDQKNDLVTIIHDRIIIYPQD